MIRIYFLDTNNSVVKAKGAGGRRWVEVGKVRGGMEDICTSVNIKIWLVFERSIFMKVETRLPL